MPIRSRGREAGRAAAAGARRRSSWPVPVVNPCPNQSAARPPVTCPRIFDAASREMQPTCASRAPRGGSTGRRADGRSMSTGGRAVARRGRVALGVAACLLLAACGSGRRLRPRRAGGRASGGERIAARPARGVSRRAAARRTGAVTTVDRPQPTTTTTSSSTTTVAPRRRRWRYAARHPREPAAARGTGAGGRLDVHGARLRAERRPVGGPARARSNEPAGEGKVYCPPAAAGRLYRAKAPELQAG